MIIVSLIAMRMAEKEGLWLVLLVSFVALPIRGLIAAFVINRWGVYPVQILDGIGAGLQSVALARGPMTQRFPLFIFSVACFVGLAGRAQAHPHVWVTMHEELLYAADGSITGVHHVTQLPT
jgi:hypothetical protein